FYESAAWILLPALFAILCLIVYSEFEHFNEHIKQEVQLSNAQQRVEYWRQSHNRLIKFFKKRFLKKKGWGLLPGLFCGSSAAE
ncbi:unnamed protein product, partial [Didymodactylos carnosus]